ncbi:MAG: GAF domain-containing protein, partial [Bacillota bacterium]
MQSMLLTSGMFFALGLLILLSLSIKSKKIRKSIILMLMLVSIPAITLQFVAYASVTVWVFPLVMMIISLVFSTRIPLLLITAVSVTTQMLVWVNKPEGAVQIDNFDYLVRINIFLLAFLVGSFVNKAYIKKLKESIFQINFQKLISETSFDFVSVNQENIDKKVNIMLGKIGHFFNLDRTYVFLINHRDNTMTYTHEWCNEGITPQIQAIQTVPLEDFPWWINQLSSNKLVYIEDVENLPEIALAEKEQLTQQGIKSLLVLSIEGDGKMLGFMGLDSVIALRKWSSYHFELLKILSNLLADGLIKIESEKEIQRMAYYDHLTGLPNRTLFSDRVTQAI